MKMVIMRKDGMKLVDLTRRTAIRERCLNCSCWFPSEVTNCSFQDCSLHPFRSGNGKQNPKARSKAIRKYCLWCMAGQRSEITRCPSTQCPFYPYRMKDVDRSVEIDSEPKMAHIESVSDDKTKGHIERHAVAV